MKAWKRKTCILILIMSFLFINGITTLWAQEKSEGVLYLEAVMDKNEKIANATWEYVKAGAHTKNMRMIEDKRKQVIAIIQKAIKEVKTQEIFKKDKKLQGSFLECLTTYQHLMTGDYAKIVDMEAIAEESYDAMEAFLLAKKKASEKMKEAGDRFHKEIEAYAKRNNITLVEKKDNVSDNLQKSGEVMDYYDEIYLIFFKPYKQEMYVINAIGKENINELEQNRNTLKKYAEEGLGKLKKLKAFDRDKSLIDICTKVLNFDKKAASEKYKAFTDFFMKQEKFMKYKKAFEAKKEADRTKQDVDKYNASVKELNNASKNCNKVNEELNKEREKLVKEWNEKSSQFMDKHVPK